MKQVKLTEKVPLLAPDGSLSTKGYATKMNVLYNREAAKTFPLKLKEWNFYQIHKDHYALQMTIGHVSYMCSVSAILIDIDSGEKWEIGTMKPLFIPKLDFDPEQESYVIFESKNLCLTYRVTRNKRILTATGSSDTYKKVEISIQLENDPANEKMVIATPFEKPHQFYLNYKENYYRGTGRVQFGDKIVDFDGCTGLIDWGRGIWPYSHQWFWGNLTAHIDGVPFGFNIGWGFGDLSNATENMFFFNRKAYKLGQLQVQYNEADPMQPWHLRDPDGLLDMTFTPVFDNYTQNKYVVIDTHCHQRYGYFDGIVQTEDGPKEFHHILAFLEHAVNRW